jgi:hypothetical protein
LERGGAVAEIVDSALLLEVLKEIWKEVREQRVLLLKANEAVGNLGGGAEARHQAADRRIAGVEERLGDLRDDLGPTIKSELASALGSIEARLARMIQNRNVGLGGL